MKESIEIANCNVKAARYACENWHYSKSMPTPPRIMYGIWENKQYIGCIIYSRGASPSIGKPFNLKQTEVCELTRVALKQHKTAVTRLISITIKMLKKTNPNIKLIISYADATQGHTGKIYQAGNWIYIGKTKPTKIYYDKQGKKYHSRQVTSKGYNKQFGQIRKTPKIQELTAITQLHKYKYIMPLTQELKIRANSLKKEHTLNQV